jgi:hypothetical protein
MINQESMAVWAYHIAELAVEAYRAWNRIRGVGYQKYDNSSGM